MQSPSLRMAPKWLVIAYILAGLLLAIFSLGNAIGSVAATIFLSLSSASWSRDGLEGGGLVAIVIETVASVLILLGHRLQGKRMAAVTAVLALIGVVLVAWISWVVEKGAAGTFPALFVTQMPTGLATPEGSVGVVVEAGLGLLLAAFGALLVMLAAAFHPKRRGLVWLHRILALAGAATVIASVALPWVQFSFSFGPRIQGTL